MGSAPAELILVAIDGSKNSLAAAGVGARMAKLLGGRLGLIHVLDLPPLDFWVGVESRMKEELRTQAEATLSGISERIAALCDVVPEHYIVAGLPEQQIERVVTADPTVTMVVAGRFGIGAEKYSTLSFRRTMGHVVEKLVMQLAVPILVIPPDIHPSHICPTMSELTSPGQGRSQ
jgi:nucleotide-binding universal stress UspA family protein